ncbi:MAG: glycosyltransferase family 39 protein, partial [Gemmatimonadota bacterium]
MDGRSDHVARILASTLLAWTILAIGIFLRLYQFSIDRGLWVDEARVALNILERSPLELLRPLEHDQVAPFGFLWLEKIAVTALGNSEYALRLFPLLAGIASLFVFRAVARRYLLPPAANIGLFLFAVSPMLVYFSAETKQYSLDVLVALGLLWMALRWMDGPTTLWSSVGLGLLGMAAVWFSHTAILLLGGFAVVLVWRWFRQRESSIGQIILILALWGAGGVLGALLPLVALPEETSAYMDEFWAAGFLPFPPASLTELGTYPSHIEWLLRSSLTLWIPGVG